MGPRMGGERHRDQGPALLSHQHLVPKRLEIPNLALVFQVQVPLRSVEKVKSVEVGVRAAEGRVCVACVGEMGASWPLCPIFPRCPSGGLGRVTVGTQQPSRGQGTRCLSASHSEEEKEVGVYPRFPEQLE